MMALDFPWMNEKLGEVFGNPFDNSPTQMKLFYLDLNFGSTYGLAFSVIIVSCALGYTGISIFSSNQEKRQLRISTYFNFMYNIFIYGALFSSMLAIQGCVNNSIHQIFSFDRISYSASYIVGLLMFVLILIDLVHSLFKYQ